MGNKMTTFNMNDIHSGFVVKFRNGKCALCMRVGTKFTKIFARVDEEAKELGAIEENTFVYTSRYNKDGQYTGYNRFIGRPEHMANFDVVAVYGLLEGVRNYLNIGDTGPISIKNRPLLWEENIKEMTLEEIEKQLGHKVKIVNNDTPKNDYPIKSEELCKSCKYHTGGSLCGWCKDCEDCSVCNSERTPRCNCSTIPTGQPCPYFLEETKR